MEWPFRFCDGCDNAWIEPVAIHYADNRDYDPRSFDMIPPVNNCAHEKACLRIAKLYGEAMQDDGR